MLAGLPGTGKTTLAYEIGRMFGWTVLDKDLFNVQLLNAGLSQSQAGTLAYELMFRLARDLVIQQRHSVILDTAGRQPRILQQARLIARDAPARLQIVRLIASHAVRKKRMASRIPCPSQWVADETTDEEEGQGPVAAGGADTPAADTSGPFDLYGHSRAAWIEIRIR